MMSPRLNGLRPTSSGRTSTVPSPRPWAMTGMPLRSRRAGTMLALSEISRTRLASSPASMIRPTRPLGERTGMPTFTPSAATLVSPVAPATTSFTDTAATPTKADDPDPFGRAYYYMVAVKTKDGQVVADQWSGAAGCATGQQGGPPCSARSVRERVP